VRIRRSVAARLHGIRGGPAATGPVATFARTHLRGLRIGAVALAVLTFVFLEQPTGAAILVIAALLLVVLAVIEFLGRPVESAAEPEVVTDATGPEVVTDAAEPQVVSDGAVPGPRAAETPVPEARRG
jgi:hypothetical protein